MESEAPKNEWDEQPAGGMSQPARRAAVFVWVLGAVCLVVFGCLGTSALVFSHMPREELRFELSDRGITVVEPSFLVAISVMATALGVVPGLAYLAAGFGVRRGRPIAINIALYIALTQAIVFGLLTLASLTDIIRAGDPQNLTKLILTFGTFLALLGYTIRCLLQALQAARGGAEV